MHPDRRQQLDQQWLESLLTETYQPDTRSEQRVTAVMQQLSPPVAPLARAPWYSLRNLSALAIAASLFILAMFVVDNSEQKAYATVARSAKATELTRHYRLQMIHHRPAIGRREIEADLYIDPANRFVLKHPGMMGFGTAWIGGDAEQRWIAPPRGPVIVGGEEIVGRWLRAQDIASPYLNMSTMLKRMGSDYSLTMLADVDLQQADGVSVTCTHIRGDIREPRGGLPRVIELWANAKTGVAQKIILHWAPAPNRPGPVRWNIELHDTPGDLPSNWFEIDGHAAGRPIIRARTDKDVEQNVQQ